MTTSQSPQQGNQSHPTAYPHPGQTGPQPSYQHGRAPQQQYGPPPQQYGPPPGAIPQQWAPAGPGPQQPAGPGPQQPAGWGPVPAAAPRNGLGIAALCLGTVGILFGMVPFTGFIAFALGAVGLILGLVGLGRARRKVASNLKTAVSGTVLSVIAIALGIWGMVILFTGLNQLAEDLNNIPTASAPAVPGTDAGTIPADVTTPVTTGATSYKLEITGDAEKMMVGYGTDSANSFSGDYESLPWSTTVETSGEYGFANVNASSSGPGSITCTITDVATGQVVSTQTAQSLDDSEYGSANVSCSSMG